MTTKAKGSSQKTKPPAKTPTSRIRRWGRRALIGLGAVVLLSILQVVWVRFFDPPGTPLMIIRKLEARVADEQPAPVRYEWLPLEEVPEEFLRFVWVAEDGRFFRHHGFDFHELRIAVRQAWAKRQAPRGASTITMQCARSLFLWQGRSVVRKGLEAYYTVLMELILPKKRILELYVNVIEMGDGVYGVEAAAQHHFHGQARSLDPAELAALVAILPNPRAWDPVNPTDRVLRRQELILERSRNIRLPESVR